jgi:leader peptidase (prepilin peptidase)/N-methyltransferase
LVLPLFPIALVTDITASFISGEWWRLGLALALAFSIFTLGMVANYFDVLGMGDVKLLSATALVTAWFIWWLPLAVIGGTLVLSILVIIYKVFIGKTRLGDNIPLGPYAVALALIFGTLGVLSI